MILQAVVVGAMQVNCYILASREQAGAIIIDPGAEIRKIEKVLKQYKLTPVLVINTHGHYDHIGGDDAFGVKVYVHSLDVRLLTKPELNLSAVFSRGYKVNSQIHELKEGQVVALDDIELEVIHLPGHTSGGIGLLMKKPQDNILFSGDVLFCRGIGRSDFPGGDGKLLIQGIKNKLMRLSDDVIVYPGHGPSTTIGQERQENPFLS